jgi:alkanesulfonate monooxygenase SsuD/methylene tetrahydromethanopterin reductase-like flavin-dependent oxidoreductase (luciferase family)
VGWNIVTTGNPETSFNFGREVHMAHDDRYARARACEEMVFLAVL